MKGPDRRDLLLHRVRESGYLSATDAAADLGVDTSTIRRDLAQLEELGLLRRSHGGAVPRRDEADIPIDVKLSTSAEQKRAIAATVAALIPPGASLMLDSGSTTLMVARALADHPNLTVVTPDVWIAAELITRRNVTVIVPGGESLTDTTTVVSQEAVSVIDRHHVDIAVMAVDAVDGHRATNSNGAVVALKRAMMRAAVRTILVADSSKFGHRHLVEVAGTEEFDEIVTDDGIDPDVVRDYPATFHIAPSTRPPM